MAEPRAFPSVAIDPKYAGMDLRDWFAGQALAGILSSIADDHAFNLAFTEAAPAAYRLADGMMAERAKRENAGG